MSEALTVGLVLVAAALHAGWNTAVKGARDRELTFAGVIATSATLYLPFALVRGLPAAESLPWILGSASIHLLYYTMLLRGYRLGDLSQVYPIARGLGPLLVATVGGPLAGEALSLAGGVGALLVTGGLVTLAQGRASSPAVRAALLTGVAIAGYTTCDGLGVRASGDRLAYVAWGHVATGYPYALWVMARRRGDLRAFWADNAPVVLGGGLVSGLAYGIAIWAMSTSTLASVASLRETSVILAAWLGARRLGEPFGQRRVIAAAAVALGIVLISGFGLR